MFSGMVFIFAPLVVGYLFTITQPTWLNRVNKTTSYLIYVILALMGLSLAALDNLGANLHIILTYTVTFVVILGLCNLSVLPLVDRLLPLRAEQQHKKLPLSAMIMESLQLVFIVAAGLIVGLILPFDLHWVNTASESILFILLFLIGIQLRNSGLTLRQILLNKHGMIIAVVMICSSLLGGVIVALILGMPMMRALAMASGFGWYSLSGILMGDAFGPIYGGAAFMIELARELIALMMIPLLIHRRPCTAIGYAGATAMDFTLPVIQSTGGVRCVPIAIVSGFILSLFVPVLMLFFVSLAH